MTDGILSLKNSLMVQVRDSRECLLHIGIATVTLAFIAAFYSSYFSIHQDLAGGVLTAKLALIQGENLLAYGIYFPPIEEFWFSFANWLQSVTGLRVDVSIAMMTGIAVLFSTELAYLVRKKTVGATPLFFMISIAALVALPIVFKNVFGLREHMVALGLWPYFVLRISDPDGTKTGTWLRVVIGIWLGFTLLFKYLYSVLVLFVEIADALVQRRVSVLFRAENLISGLFVFSYLFLWLGLQPENREVINAMVSGLNANLKSPLDLASKAGLELCLTISFLLVARQSGATHRQMFIGLACVLGAIVVALIQARWYPHHAFPIFLGYILWLWILGANLPKWFRIIVFGWLAFSAAKEFRSIGYYQTTTAAVAKTLKNEGISLENKKVGLLALHPSPFNQVIAKEGGVRWTPFMNLAYVAAELSAFDLPENNGHAAPTANFSEPGRQLLHNQLLSLWEDYPPDVVIMDHSTNWPLKYLRVEWRRLLSEDVRFDEILKSYRLKYSADLDGVKYDYYIRNIEN